MQIQTIIVPIYNKKDYSEYQQMNTIKECKMTLKRLSLAIVATTFAVSVNAHDSQEHSYWDKYQSLATEISNNVESSSLEKLTKQSVKLTKLSTKLLPDFIKKQPICTEYLTAALKAAPTMTSLSLDDIEKDYHADGKLPAVKSASCYHAKDLLVHPATMAVIGKTLKDTPETRKQMAHELEEVLEHFNQVKVAAGI